VRAGAQAFNLSLGVAALLNYIYEAEAGCTSIVARTPSGTMLHGRNLDFSMPSVLSSLTMQVQFTRSGQPLILATTYAGYVGVLTGLRIGGYSVTVDQRQSGIVLENLIEAFLVHNSTSVAALVRNTLENFSGYTDALTELSKLPIVAPVYFIVGGLAGNEGAIITRDRNYAVNVWPMNSTYIVETNYPPWLPDPPSDPRRTVAEEALEKIGAANIGFAALFQVLSMPLVLNNGTTYTALMQASNGTLITVSR